ncbi:MAG: urease accessory protein UreF [Pseudomonadota bacterium]
MNTAITSGLTAVAMDNRALFRLMTWLSPSYPVGAFAYSHGIEWAVETGWVTDAYTLEGWIEDLLRHGGGWSDSVLFCQAYDQADDLQALISLNDLALALAASKERYLETTAQGTAFLKITRDAWSWPGDEALRETFDETVAYPLAVAAAAAGHRIAKEAAMQAYLHGFVANLISAGVRLIPLGQTAGQRVLAALEATGQAVQERAIAASLDDLGGATLRSDIASMQHETQYTRLFRT